MGCLLNYNSMCLYVQVDLEVIDDIPQVNQATTMPTLLHHREGAIDVSVSTSQAKAKELEAAAGSSR